MATKKTQILILPYPIQGHINPMLQFAKRLASKSRHLILTLLLPTSHARSISSHIGSINVQPISDGADQQGQQFQTAETYLQQFQRAVPGSLDDLIRLERGHDQPQPTILIYDSFFPWALDVAHSNGLAAAPFFTQTCSVSSVYFLFKEGRLSDEMELPHGIPRLEQRDLPSFIQDKENSAHLLELLVDQFSNLDEADYVFFNTFDKLENQMVEWMARQWQVLTVGPTIPSMYLDKCVKDDRSYGLNLFKPNRESCRDWLCERRASSVIYVSFGSMAILKQEQIEEIAKCLENLQTRFIWVVRETEMAKLPSEFVEWNLSSGLGLVVTWCNQLDILAHETVGCFVTHCGWNSVLEALCLGVPMVGVPNWSDQPTNAKFVEDVWKVGVRAKEDEDGIVKSMVLEKCVRAVLEGEKGEVVRRNAGKIKRWALEAVQLGGSSDNNIAKFVTGLALKD
uniref:Glycosyltransferase n=1 Tax=Rhodiola sachalinensis TaxID=265354 RepID=A4ZZ92_RHOSK|nr:UDP-glucose glucosyltransferase [Rhodiola sachalinensis]